MLSSTHLFLLVLIPAFLYIILWPSPIRKSIESFGCENTQWILVFLAFLYVVLAIVMAGYTFMSVFSTMLPLAEIPQILEMNLVILFFSFLASRYVSAAQWLQKKALLRKSFRNSIRNFISTSGKQ